MSTSCLNIYHEIAFLKGMDKIMGKFLPNEQLEKQGFTYLKQYDYYIKDEMVVDGDDPVFHMTIINRENYLKSELLKVREYIITSSILEENTLLEFLDELASIISKVEIRKDELYFNIVYQELLDLTGDIKLRSGSKIKNHAIFNKIRRINSSLSYFQCKDLPSSFIADLYNTTYSLDLIDDVIVSEEDFYKTFTAPEPKDEILFRKANTIVAFYLKAIEPFFDNLNAVTIETSKCFLNKQGKKLNSTDLYTSLSRGKNKNTSYKYKIEQAIQLLKDIYLK